MLARLRKHQWLIFGILAALVVAAILLASNSRGQSVNGQMMTLDPQIIDNMTLLPQSGPLTGSAADEVNRLRSLVNACAEYSPERRTQVLQEIDWLINPASIPPDLLVAFGADPHGKLIFAIASVTSNQWRLDGRSTD